MSKFISPVYNVIAVPIEKIVPNVYNPNSVAPPEMALLYDSIKQDGYTMPIVCYYDKEQDFYENTTIIIVGDHPTMSHDFDGWIGEGYERKVFTTIINPATEYEDNITREYSTLDMFPTTLAAMGVTINGDRLALGTNLFSEEKRSEFMDSLNEIVLTENYRDRIEKETTLNISNSPEGGKNVEIITQSNIASVPNLNFSLRAWGVEEGCVIIPVTEMEETDEGLYRTTVSLNPGKWAFLDCLL